MSYTPSTDSTNTGGGGGRSPFPFIRRIGLPMLGWLHFKIALGIGWTTAMLFSTPYSIDAEVSRTSIQVWTIGTCVGAIASIIGMFMTLAMKRKTALVGLHVEFIGLMLFAGGPIQYFLVQLSLLSSDPDSRIAIAWFAYSMLAAILARMSIVGSRIFRELKQAKA